MSLKTISVVGKYCADGVPNQTEREQDFRQACQAIGKALARHGHPILLCIPEWPTRTDTNEESKYLADYVVQGAEAAARRIPSEITLFRTPEIPPANLDGTIPQALRGTKKLEHVNLRCKPLPSGPGYYPESFPSVKDADAIILIGGEYIHECVACVAHYIRDQPVVAIPAFGGRAEKLYKDIFRDSYETAASRDARIQGLVGVLDETWHRGTPQSGQKSKTSEYDERATRIVKLTERLCSANEKKARSEGRTRIRFASLGMVLCVVWLLLFTWLGVAANIPSDNAVTATAYANSALTATTSPAPVAMPAPAPALLWAPLKTADFGASILLWFVLLLAAAIGMMLGTLAAYRAGEITRLDGNVLLTDMTAAIVLAFGFGIIYFAGGWAFESKVEAPRLGETTLFIAAILSILGLAAGFLLPVEALSTRLPRRMPVDESGKPN